jgi:hypothetical protein
LRCTGEELAGAVVATVFASARADCDNGRTSPSESVSVLICGMLRG